MSPASNTSVLDARDLTKAYAGKTVVDSLSLQLAPGEIVGLLGPNGAGKSTTVGMLYGAIRPTAGRVSIGASDVVTHGRAARRIIGVVTQDDNPDPDVDVEENLIFFARYYGVFGEQARKRAGEILELVRLAAERKKLPDELSGGYRRRLALARALVGTPQLLFLDEPTTGLDPDARQDFWRIILSIRAHGCGILLTTHYMDEAQRLCDRVVLLQHGRNVREGAPDTLIEQLAGEEIVEVEGISQQQVEGLATAWGTWFRPYGTGHLIALPRGESAESWDEIAALRPNNLRRRRANLEDVFLVLTGEILG